MKSGRSVNVGFTLVEILVTLAVLGILLGIALPNLSALLRRIQVNAVSADLANALQQGRNEAIKLSARVLVCAGNAAGTACTATTDWGSNGWLVCHDTDANGACDGSTSELPNPLYVHGPVASGLATVTGPAAAIVFTSTGACSTPTTSPHLTVTAVGATGTTTVSVQGSGHVKGTRI
jgi:type IV fimbrial biogenesis protein FimT